MRSGPAGGIVHSEGEFSPSLDKLGDGSDSLTRVGSRLGAKLRQHYLTRGQ
jgi:hypothetical protein